MLAVRVALQTGGADSRVGHLAVVDRKDPKGRGLHARLITCHAQDIWLPLELEGNAWQHLEQCQVRVAYLEEEDSVEPTMFKGRVINVDTEEMGILVEFEDSQNEWVSLIDDEWEWVDMERPDTDSIADAVRRRTEHQPLSTKRVTADSACNAPAPVDSAEMGGEYRSEGANGSEENSHGRKSERGGGGSRGGDRADAPGRKKGEAPTPESRDGGRGSKSGSGRGSKSGSGRKAGGQKENSTSEVDQQSRPPWAVESFRPKFSGQRPNLSFARILEALREAAAQDGSTEEMLGVRQTMAAMRTLARADLRRPTELDDWRHAAAWLRDRCEAETRPLLELLHLNAFDRLIKLLNHDDEEIQGSASSIVINAALQTRCREHLLTKGSTAVAMAIIRQPDRPAAHAERALALLQNLSISPKSHAALIEDENILEIVPQLIKGTTSIKRKICALLQHLASNPDHTKDLLDAHIVPLLYHELSIGADPEIHARAVSALVNIASIAPAQEVFRATRLLELLRRLSDVPALRQLVASLAANLANEPTNKAALEKHSLLSLATERMKADALCGSANKSTAARAPVIRPHPAPAHPPAAAVYRPAPAVAPPHACATPTSSHSIDPAYSLSPAMQAALERASLSARSAPGHRKVASAASAQRGAGGGIGGTSNDRWDYGRSARISCGNTPIQRQYGEMSDDDVRDGEDDDDGSMMNDDSDGHGDGEMIEQQGMPYHMREPSLNQLSATTRYYF